VQLEYKAAEAFHKFDADGNGTLVSVPGCLRPARLRATGLS